MRIQATNGRRVCCVFVALFGAGVIARAAWAEDEKELADRRRRAIERVETALKGLKPLQESPALWPTESQIEVLFGKAGPVKPAFLLNVPDKETLLVLGNEVDLSGANVSSAAAGIQHIAVLARKITVANGPALFRLEGSRSGGHLTLVALEGFEGMNTITVSARGKDGANNEQYCAGVVAAPAGCVDFAQHLHQPAEPGGSGGTVTVYGGTLPLPRLSVTNTGGAAGVGCDYQIKMTAGLGQKCFDLPVLFNMPPNRVCIPVPEANSCATTVSSNRVTDAPAGVAGASRTIGDLESLASMLPTQSSWLWSYGMLQALNRDIQDAVRVKDNRAVLRLFRDYKALPTLPVPPDKVGVQGELLGILNTLRTEVLAPFWARDMTLVAPNLAPIKMSLVTDSDTLENHALPTGALLRTEAIQNRPYLGLLQADAARPGRLVVRVGGKLNVDPLLEWLLRNELRKTSEPYSGMAVGLKFAGQMEAIPGVDGRDVDVRVSGDVIDIAASVPEEAANVFFYKLGSLPGLRLDLTSMYQRQVGVNVVSVAGPPFSLYLSSLKREGQTLQVDSGQIKNFSRLTATANYVVDGAGAAYPLPPGFAITPGSFKPIPEAVAARVGLRVPPEAIEYSDVDPFSLSSDFFIAADSNLVQRIVVTSRLPSVDPGLGGALRYVEVYLEYWDSAVGSPHVKRGPYRLSGADTQGAELKLDIIRSPARAVTTRVSGTAYYENGSRADLIPFETQDLTIKITPDRQVTTAK